MQQIIICSQSQTDKFQTNRNHKQGNVHVKYEIKLNRANSYVTKIRWITAIVTDETRKHKYKHPEL